MRLRSVSLSVLVIVLLSACDGMAQPKAVTFGAPAQYSAGISSIVGGFATSPLPALTADLNHDGYGDFVSVDWTAGTVVVVLGGAKGFQAPASFPAVAHPVSIAIGDFNKDGNLDLLVVGDTSAVLLGTGTGTFEPPVTIDASAATYGAVGDFNGDSNPDVAIADMYNDRLLVALGNGDGTFGHFVLTPVTAPWALYPGDFHNNGRQDLILVPKKHPVCLLTSNGDGTFRQGPAILPAGTWGIAVADMNQDGNPDFVTINPVRVWLGDGQGNFTATASRTDETAPDYVTVADVNGDGIPDVVTADEGSAVSIFLGEGGGKLQAPYSYKANAGPMWVGVGAYFGSDRADIALLNGGGNHIPAPTLSLLRSATPGNYAGVRNIELHNASAFALGDMNQDGLPDLVVTNAENTSSPQPGLWILPGLGNGSFDEPIAAIDLPSAAASPVIADFDGDGTPDFAVTLQSYMSTTIDVGLLQPGNTFKIVSTMVPAQVSIAWAGDLNGDGLPDLVLVNADCFNSLACGTVYTLLNIGQGTFGNPLQITTSHGASALSFIAVADFNNDGKPDLAVGAVEGCGSESGPAILLGNGDGSFGAPICLGSSYAYAIVAGDFNHDGNQDVAMLTQVEFGAGLLVFLGNGKGGFHALPSQPFQGPPELLFAADLNGDGFPDLASVASTNYGYSLQVYLGTGTGGFSLEPITYFTSGYYGELYSAQLADLNNDGKIDLVTLSGAFSILLNTSP